MGENFRLVPAYSSEMKMDNSCTAAMFRGNFKRQCGEKIFLHEVGHFVIPMVQKMWPEEKLHICLIM